MIGSTKSLTLACLSFSSLVLWSWSSTYSDCYVFSEGVPDPLDDSCYGGLLLWFLLESWDDDEGSPFGPPLPPPIICLLFVFPLADLS